MRHETQVDLFRRFLKLYQDRTTEMLPSVRRTSVDVYLDPDRAATERNLLFRGRPIIAALSADVPEPGSCVAVEIGDVPVLLVRGEDTQVRAFLNACRHRGSRIAEGHGMPGRVFSCPFHAWTYDLNGELLGQPLAREAFDECDPSELSLLPIPVAEAAGLIAVTPGASEPPDLADDLGGIGEELDEWNLGDFRFLEERVVTVAANWKLVYDTFLEGYHIFSLHRRTVGRILLSTPAIGDAFGHHTRSVVFGKDVPRHLRTTHEDEWDLKRHASIVYQLFPNTVINLPQSGHAELWQVFPDPERTDRCRVHLRFYTPGPVDDEQAEAFWRANVEFTHNVVLVEDFGQQEAIQRNMSSGLMTEVLHGRNEPPLQRFHDAIDAALTE
ncbi:MAG TPA: aromatic ring-hydroxylating dioxygenase subunit alpha, partial [Nitriliruptorales bacterium]